MKRKKRSISDQESDALFAEVQRRLREGESYHIKREEIQNGPFGVCEEERDAIIGALEHARTWGYGNMISWLQREWDRCLAESVIRHRASRASRKESK